MIMTGGLRVFIEQYKQTLSEDEFRQLQNDIDAAMRLFAKDLLNHSAGVDRGRRVHQLLEAEISKVSNIATSCHKGCAACCHFEVEITKDDAEVLKQSLTPERQIDLERLAEQAKRPRQGAEWRAGKVTNNRCVFLGKDNACRSYEDRPSACRKLAVTSDPIECATPNGIPRPRVIPMAEILLSASLSCEGNPFGSLASMLSAALDLKTAGLAPSP